VPFTCINRTCFLENSQPTGSNVTEGGGDRKEVHVTVANVVPNTNRISQ
jgi:hypothetical protein